MKTSWFHRLALASAGTAVLVLASLHADEPPLKTTLDDSEPGIEVQDSGPVHEAFAQPGAAVRGPGPIVTKAPPPPVPELPPDVKPEGEHVIWVPGYWHWDDMKQDYIWMSGFWRNAPEGREWQAGEWKKEAGGYRYVAGFWKKQNVVNFERNLPKPPETIENGPSVPAPHKDAVWVPGHWENRPKGYAWRGGYWGEAEENMLWTPPQYVWNTSGYQYVSGYWDYCLEDRGLLYAPVYFSRPLWLNSGWCYRPRLAINVGYGGGWGWGWGDFYSSLFIGPGCNSFFYGPRYGGWWNWGFGYRPWCHSGRGYYNHVYNHYCWLNRGHKNWSHHVRNNFAAQAVGLRPHGAATVANAARLGNANSTRLGNANAAAARDVLANRGTVARDGRQSGVANRSLVQPAKQVLTSQQQARRVQVTPSGTVTRAPAANVAARTRALDGNATSRTLPSQRSFQNGTADMLRNRGGEAVRGQPFRGEIDQRVGRQGSFERVNPPTRGEANLPTARTFDADRGTRGVDRSSFNRTERSLPSSRGGFDMPSAGSRSSPSSGRSFSPSSGSSRGSFSPPSGGSRGGSGGGSRSGIGGGSSGGGSRGGGKR